MNTLSLYGKRDLRFVEAEKPVIEKSDEVIIKIKSVGICGSDISRYKKLGPYIEGMVWGHEFSGEVINIGSDVESISLGDSVAGCPSYVCGECESCKKAEFSRCDNLTVIGARHPGAYAEYIKLPIENVVKVPEGIEYDEAAMVEPSSVVAHGFYKTRIHPGDEVAIMGCGNIGLLAIQWAKIFGAKKVYAIDIDNEKLNIAKNVGADILVNSLDKTAYSQIMNLTNNRGVDLAVESAGSPITSAEIFGLARKGGEVLFMGIPYADVKIDRFHFERIVRNELTVLGSWSCISAPFPGKEWATTLHYMENKQLNVKPLITHRLPLEKGPETFEKIINKEETFGKVIFHPEK
ncbi:galactitol-1-phosphate 5-dehydrogenase [Staphylococcus lentus]|uniref:galactitol-1-phosphate 5-dehydrogenase n=1 Tax=Mammaliicoccus lentus TaxID=42858 RepID=UPI0018846F4D|nr:galactitol-1-phosphate 5-dehydrogenase [Mammaliicoccus lentus]MBF0840393.1 galactitol-1-phosphate 5-dehydrogenase [Mammaliicoccus lentus]